MANLREVAQYGLDALLRAGADKAQCVATFTEKHEMNVELGEFSLLRTTFDTNIGLTAIKDSRRGSTAINKSDNESMDKAAAEVLAIAAASAPDEAYDIAEAQPPAEFSSGSDAPDLDRMYSGVKELLHQVKARYPKLVLMQAIIDFTRSRSCFVNSNNVDFVTNKGVYNCMFMFTSKDQDKVSSFNYTSFSLRDLERDLLECGSLDILLKQSTEQIITRPLQGRFVGDLIITPDCMNDMLWFVSRTISDGPMISGTSIYKDKLGQQIASPLLTLHSRPVSDEICNGYFVTSDGYAAQNSTIVESGVLKTYLLSLYGSRKTGFDRAVNMGGAFVMEPGDTSLDDMIKSVEKGILLARFSGGYPSDSGDFSGVAKNSYLIEGGRIKYPISESMVSGNFAEMLKNIKAISRERIDYGFSILPWVHVSGITVSGK
ncbi:MAG: TldD/PmbA family protein [Bacillota bacterium]|jgi:PmbA protein|nr:TldD/PmbA family protein [Candidatus Fermentithermobacillaceae bacterium]